MALHRLTSVTMGVPNVAETAAYYTDFGLTPDGDGWFTTRDAGRQLHLVHAPTRRLIELRVGADDPDDLAAAASRLERVGAACERHGTAVLVLKAPVTYLHHTSWQVDDVDDVGRGATAMLEDHPERHIWGLGRHHAGSNFFWYLKDPAGTFSEYYSDMDCVADDQLWTPEVLEGAKGLFNWGPPPPPSFLHPEDLAALMSGSHSD
ncbi:VOC family protein [Streptomyces iconiensis]|uniref:VOC family protein n=1 Tax=Streptomyces iconiensis TaxID=1384038 RepID=A0ABT6ZUJ1_9ACTN|nr:VOC family protein [Streptomyces iconiensis]MDJ1132728.1 VOC family protein [Streptomyces iconiensis]